MRTINKGAKVGKQEISSNDLDKINLYALEPLTSDDVFTFKLAMSNNKIDRDFERMGIEALTQLVELFKGRTIINDHSRSTKNQCGRIYECELRTTDEILENGEYFTELIAHCYMLNTDTNQDLIKEIKGGIKKEVSIGFQIGSAVCSICGKDNMKESCSHWWGKEYDGKQCYFTFSDVKDAYEVSFVAVPAVPGAGTTKEFKEAKEKAMNESKLSAEKERQEQMMRIRLRLLEHI